MQIILMTILITLLCQSQALPVSNMEESNIKLPLKINGNIIDLGQLLKAIFFRRLRNQETQQRKNPCKTVLVTGYINYPFGRYTRKHKKCTYGPHVHTSGTLDNVRM